MRSRSHYQLRRSVVKLCRLGKGLFYPVSPEKHHCPIESDFVKPSAKRRISAESIKFPPSLKEHFLCEVLSIGAALCHAQTQTVNQVPVDAVDLFKGGRVPALCFTYQSVSC